ncbi:RNA polymerase Rpb7 [Pisolithus thermaeus]|nr:RNA polymerase Rpb7 [Pisolithus thermaeus]
MFVLSTIKDTIPVLPANFGVDTEEALINEINKKYANRVLHDVGLCICLFDLAEAGEGKVRYGDGCHWYKVRFRMVVLRPFASEVILAKVKSSDEDGIRLSVGFFDDIYVPLGYLPQPSAFDPNERSHFWLPDSDATTAHELLESPTAEPTEGVAVKREARRPPYTITCSVAEQGLGPVSWWKSAQPEAEVMDDT